MVCPYSLTIPGGVQSQVLGLARTLRTLGHEVRVLAPCDGAPPDPATTPLGASIPFAENGSVAPIAPDPACALRTIRALRDEGFDVVHLHEPLVPGPTLTALLFTDAPLVGTFHRSGRSDVYDKFRSQVQWCADHLDIRVAVSAEAARTASSALLEPLPPGTGSPSGSSVVAGQPPSVGIWNGFDAEDMEARIARAGSTTAPNRSMDRDPGMMSLGATPRQRP